MEEKSNLTLRKEPLVPLNMRMEYSNSFWLSSPLLSHYTDWTIPAPQVFNPYMLGLSAQRILQNTQDSNGYLLLCMSLTNNCRQHLVFSATQCALTNVVFWCPRVNDWQKNVKNNKHLMKAAKRLFCMLLYSEGWGGSGGNKLMTYQSMLRIWLCSARNETGDSMASRDLAQRRTTLSPVRWIFSVNWSTAILDGAQTRTEPPLCFTKWYTMVADVTVFPVPGGPWINDNGRWTACFTAYTWKTTKHYMNLTYINYMEL